MGLAVAPVRAMASQPDTDIILGTAESERQDDAADRPDISARNAIVMGKDGTVYYERDADAEVKIASVTKVMTAIVALENADLEDTITVDNAAATVGESSAGLQEGDTMTLECALRALLMPSGNDAAMAIADTLGADMSTDGSSAFDAFVAAMNEKAEEIGMENTLFTNPHGLDFNGWEGDLHSTARDVAKMLAYAMTIPEFRALTSSTDNVISVTGADGTQRDVELEELNTILGTNGNIGGKTGSTYEALRCFAGAFSRDTGGEVYTVVLGCEEEDTRWNDTLTLANWYYDHVANYPVAASDATAADGSTLVARATDSDWTDRLVDVTAQDPSQTVEVFTLAGEVEQSFDLKTLSGNIHTGDGAGTMTLTQNGTTLATVQLVAAQDQAAPNILEWLLVKLDRLARRVSGQPLQAEAEIINSTTKASEAIANDLADRQS